MSAQWMGYFFDETDLADALLLLALAIADHADSEGRCWSRGIDLLAAKIRKKKRYTQELIKELEELGHVEVTRGSGRGKLSKYQLKKVRCGAPFTAPKRVHHSAPLVIAKGCAPQQERVRPGDARYKEEPFKPSISERERETRPPAGNNKDHPAIRAYRTATGFFPHAAAYDEVIDRLGPAPDAEKLARAWKTWCLRGNRPTNVEGILDWYEFGIPEAPKPATNGNGNGRSHEAFVEVLSADEPAAIVAPPPRRPPADVTKDEAVVWSLVRDHIRRRVNQDVFETWFEPVIFDGIAKAGDNDPATLKLRAGRVTYDWIQMYYTELLDGAAEELGGEISFAWEIEDSVFPRVDTS